MIKDRLYNIYALICPIDKEVKYIGVTCHKNPKNIMSYHLSDKPISGVGYSKKMKWIQSLKKLKKEPIQEIIEEVPEKIKNIRKQYWINHYDTINKCNGMKAPSKNREKVRTGCREKDLAFKIEIRVSEFEKNRIKWLAKKYANGNMSLYMIYHAMNAPRKNINPEYIEEFSKRRNKKGD